MKNCFLVLTLATSLFTACSNPGNNKTENAESSLEQEAQLLKCEDGSTLTAIYFAEGDMVAVKIKRDQEKEEKLSARGTNPNGDPFFGNSTYTWELLEDGKAGRLTHKDGSDCIYR